MKRKKISKHLLEAHSLISGAAKPKQKAHGKAEYRHLNEVRSIFRDRNIVGLGIAEKVSEKKRTGEMSLCFYVEKKLSKKKLLNHKMIPPIMSVAGRTVVTDVFEIGIVRSQAPNVQSDPIQSGFSVSHATAFGAGTVGAIVTAGGNFYILSNSHVLARSGNAPIGSDIIYPGKNDASPDQVVATLTEFVPFQKTENLVNEVDAALAKINLGFTAKINFQISGASQHVGVTEPAVDNKIVVFGRESGRVESTIRDPHCGIAIRIDGAGKIGFKEQVRCDAYSSDGDSGSIVVDKDSKKVVGLHFSGSNTASLFTPISKVRSALTLKFDFVDF